MQGTPSAKQLEAFKSEKARHAAPSHICAGTGLAHATSAPGLGSPTPHLLRDSASLCTRTGADPLTHP
jgi:hypothetical protein